MAQAPESGPTITEPFWLQLPKGSDLAALYPKAAERAEQNGLTVMQCGVTGEGFLTDCSVTSETPPGFGFAEATLALSSKFRMRARAKDGRPVAGGRVSIPISFRVTDTPTRILPNPPWAQAPTLTQVKGVYLAAASTTGTATVRCGLEETGRTRNCSVLTEAPTGKGLGEAALSLTDNFLLQHMPGDGPALRLLSVDIPFSFGDAMSAGPIERIALVRGPSPQSVQALFPAAAREAKIFEGLVRLDCAAGVTGEMRDCRVVSEEPAGFGFGAAGIVAAQAMSISAWVAPGGPAEGRRLSLPIRMKASGPPATP